MSDSMSADMAVGIMVVTLAIISSITKIPEMADLTIFIWLFYEFTIGMWTSEN